MTIFSRLFGVKRRGGRPPRAMDIVEAKRRYEAGETLLELSAAFGPAVSTIRKRLADAGCKIRSPGGERGEWPPLAIAMLDADPNITFVEVGAKFGVSRERVRQIVTAAQRSDILARPREMARRAVKIEAAKIQRGRLAAERKTAVAAKLWGRARPIIELRNSGVTWTEIASHLGHSSGEAAQGFVLRWARAAGVDLLTVMPSYRGSSKLGSYSRAAAYRQTVELLKDGMSVTEVAAARGVGTSSVYHAAEDVRTGYADIRLREVERTLKV